MQEIKFPTQRTYFIVYVSNRICSWGVVETDQEMTSGHPHLYQTTSEGQWLAELQNYYVYWGYQLPSLEIAEATKEIVDSYYGQGTAQISFASYNNPQFWYILGDFPEVLGEPSSFQVYPE